MKIALACNNISFIAGGPRLLFNLARHLEALGHTAVIYAPDAGGSHFKDITRGLHIVEVNLEVPPRAPARALGFLGWAFDKLERDLREILLAKKMADAMDADFDIVNVHDFAYRTGFFYKVRNPNAKVVWNENGTLFVYVPRGKFFRDVAGTIYWFFKKWRDKRYFRAMDRMVVLDNYNKKRREAAGGHDVHVVRCGLDVEKFLAPVKDFHKRAAHKEIELLAVGALHPYRRFGDVLDAVRLLREEGYDARAKIVAANIWHEDATRIDLEAMMRTYGLEPYIHFYFEGLPENELVWAFQESDVFVQAVYAPPPAHHGWGIVNFEAMASGLPVILTRSATATEVLKDGETVLLFDPLSPKKIAEKAKFLLDHPDEYDKIARAGQRYVQENLSWRKFTEGMLAVFQDAMRR